MNSLVCGYDKLVFNRNIHNKMNSTYPVYGSLAKSFHGVTMGISTIILLITLPLLIWRRNIYPLKAFSFAIQLVQIIIMWMLINYLNLLILVGVDRFPCWLDNFFEYFLAYLYLGITLWRVMRIYFILRVSYIKRELTKESSIRYIRLSNIYLFLSGRFGIIYFTLLGLIHLGEIIVGLILIVIPYYDNNNPSAGCIYYIRSGGLEDTISSLMILIDAGGYVVFMFIFTLLIIINRIHDIYGVVKGIFITWIHLVISASYFLLIRIVFALIPSTSIGAVYTNLNVLSSTTPFTIGITIDMIVNILIPTVKTFSWNKKGDTTIDIESTRFFLPGSTNNDAMRLLKKYATRELSIENILFLEDMVVFKISDEKERKLLAKDIYNKFLSPSSTFALNIPYDNMDLLSKKIQGESDMINSDIFDSIIAAVESNCMDTFWRFSRTSEYKQFKDKHIAYMNEIKNLKEKTGIVLA